MTHPDLVWHVPVRAQDVPDGGSQFNLDADSATRSAVAALAGVPEVTRLQAALDVKPARGGGLHVRGTVSASVRQVCVVTLEPLTSEINEDVDVRFAPAEEGSTTPDTGPPPDIDALENGTVDLGAIAVEFLMLGIDPYPRKPDVVFTAPAPEAADEHPFAALAAFKREADGKS